MDISNFTVEDFVLDKEFRLWVLFPNTESNILWENLLQNNSSQLKKIKIAKEIIINLSIPDHRISPADTIEIWGAIEQETDQNESEKKVNLVIPLNSVSTLGRYERQQRESLVDNQSHRTAAILAMAFGLSIIMNLMYPTPQVVLEVPLLVYEEHTTTPGVKSTLTLQDGSKVILNSGSTLRYLKNFESDKRILYLNGEAYFEVMRDSLRPFSVITGDVVTTALGTSFNIRSYKNEEINISLLDGKVAVDISNEKSQLVLLEKGEGLRVNLESGKVLKGPFDIEYEIGWTQKKIIFEKVKLHEAIRIIENWYGVKFILQNNPDPALLLTGVFQDETIENVLLGLSYTANLDFEIKKDIVKIKFK